MTTLLILSQITMIVSLFFWARAQTYADNRHLERMMQALLNDTNDLKTRIIYLEDNLRKKKQP